MEWGLIQVDLATLEPIDDAEQFDGDAATEVSIEDLDLMLTGATEGPVGELCWRRAREIPPVVDPTTGNADGGSAASIIDPGDVRQCAQQVAGISRDKFAPYDVAIQGASHAVDEGQGPTYYGWLAASTQQFQRFIASAAKSGAALRFWTAG